jgi:hypothetical protein
MPFAGSAIAVFISLFISTFVHAQANEDYQVVEEKQEQDYSFQSREGNEPVLQPRHIPEARIKEIKDQDAFWYADKIFKKEKEAPEVKIKDPYVPVSERTWFQTLLWLAIIGGFAGALIWFLSENKVGLFSRKTRAVAEGESEEISEDIFAINYQKEIDKAIQQGNYRLAVRLMFLRLLKNMSDRNIINYKQDKTNLDYLMELQPTSYYSNFFRIARNYEYSWYGQFEVDPDVYTIIKKDFDQFDRMLYKG